MVLEHLYWLPFALSTKQNAKNSEPKTLKSETSAAFCLSNTDRREESMLRILPNECYIVEPLFKNS